jgi:hypothetical protein
MNINRRWACAIILAAVGIPSETRAQLDKEFDPIAFAKLRAGEIARTIEKSPREASVPRPSWDAIFKAGLLLQAGLRALLPPAERTGVALPGTPSTDDPKELVAAQDNYKTVFASGAEASPAQKAIAIEAVTTAVQQLETAGYKSLSSRILDWLRSQGHAP